MVTTNVLVVDMYIIGWYLFTGGWKAVFTNHVYSRKEYMVMSMAMGHWCINQVHKLETFSNIHISMYIYIRISVYNVAVHCMLSHSALVDYIQ